MPSGKRKESCPRAAFNRYRHDNRYRSMMVLIIVMGTALKRCRKELSKRIANGSELDPVTFHDIIVQLKGILKDPVSLLDGLLGFRVGA